MTYYTDPELAKALVAYIKQATGYTVIRSFQPTTQGVPDKPVIIYHKVSDHRHGSPLRKQVWNETKGAYDNTTIQVYETTYQIGAISSSDYLSDMVNNVSMLMADEAAINHFKALDIGILRVQDVRNPYLSNDKDQFHASPSFDLVLTYKRATVSVTPEINTYEYRVGRV